MKALSLWQPWASLWCSERKVHETRHWPTTHRGWLAVHAAKKFIRDIPPDDPLREILEDEHGGHWSRDLPTGAIIGAVNLVACYRTEDVRHNIGTDDISCGDWHPGRFAWSRDEYFLLANPLPYRGAQGLFEIPHAIEVLKGWAT